MSGRGIRRRSLLAGALLVPAAPRIVRAQWGNLIVGQAPAAAGATTWSPTDKHANITLSNGNLTATDLETSIWVNGRSTTSKTSGKWYFEVTRTTGPAGGYGIGVGLSNAALANTTSPSGGGSDSVSEQIDNFLIFSGGTSVAGPTIYEGLIWGIALDVPNNLVWYRGTFDATTWWGAVTTGNPTAGTGGFTPAFSMAGGVFILTNLIAYGGGTAAVTLNPGPTFAAAAPSGYLAWG